MNSLGKLLRFNEVTSRLLEKIASVKVLCNVTMVVIVIRLKRKRRKTLLNAITCDDFN
jgi:hypothetical protein